MSAFSNHNAVIQFAGEATAPRKGSAMAAGYDLTAAKDYTLGSGDRARVSTGLHVSLPARWFGRVEGRSGLAFNHGIYTFGGIIDSDYRGEIKVLLINLGSEAFVITRGMRIAQLIVAAVTQAELQIVENLDETQRGTGGFGSTGGV